MRCELCNCKCKNLSGLRRHITLKHTDITYKEYYDRFLISDDEKVCKVSSCTNKPHWLVKEHRYSNLCKKCSKKKDLEVHIIRFGEEEGTRIYEEMIKWNSYVKTLDGFISKYGVEEGTRRYNKRYKSEKSKCTLKGFILRHGEEEGTRRYEEYCSSVGTSLENLKRIYGEEEGSRRYEEFCKNTGITLEKYKTLYGEEEGSRRYEEFHNNLKRQNTKERYIELYGDNWETEWEKTQSKKGTSLEKLQNLYGDDKAKEVFDNIYKNPKNRTNLEGFILRYGEDDGPRMYEEYCKNLSYKSSLEYYIDKFGPEMGPIEFSKICNDPKKKTNLNGFILRYGEEEGARRYLKKIERGGSSLEKFILRDGEVQGPIKYNNYLEKVKKRLKNRKGEASKQSMNIFFPIIDWLLEKEICTFTDIKVGINGSREWCLSTKKKDSEQNVFFYDFTIPKFKLIIEFNGEKYHPNPEWPIEKWLKWCNPYTKESADIVFKKDKNKIDFAKNKSYNVLEIWSSDSLEYNINKCKNFILGEIQNEINNGNIL